MDYNFLMKLIAAFVPYLAVLLGMTLFRNAWMALLLYHLGIIACFVMLKPRRIWEKMRAGWNAPLLLPAVGVCALAVPVVYFMWPFFESADGVLPEWLAQYGLTGWAWLLLIPYFSLIHPVLEEFHWRGIAPDSWRWLCWQDLLFAGYHVLVLYQLIYWPWLFLVFGVLVVSSVFWRWTAKEFGGYGVSILTHATADAGVIIAVCLLLK